MAGDEKQVLATVDGQKVTRGQIESSLAEIAEMVDGGKPKLETFPKDFQKEFIDKYIDKMLLIEAGRRNNVHKDPVIREKVLVVEDYLTQQKYIQNLVLRQKNDKALRKIYDEKFADIEDQNEVKASHILVKTEKEAKKIKSKLDKGGDFEKLAEENSIEPGAKVGGGDLGYFVEGDMVPEFSKAAFALKKDEISEPVKTNFGWHIIKVFDIREREKLSFEKAKPALETEFARRVIEKEIEDLRSKKKIDYKIDLGQKKAEEKKVEPKVEKIEAKKPEVKIETKAEPKKPEIKKIEGKAEPKKDVKVKIEAKTPVKIEQKQDAEKEE